MDSFLQHTARSIIETMDWKQLSRTTLVLPSNRAGLVLKDELLRLQQERNATAIWAPRVQTLPQLQDELSPLYAEDELFTIVRLYKLYLSVCSADSSTELISLDVFYGWGKQMLADFTNVDASMPAEQVPNFFDNTIAAHELGQWDLDPDVEERLRKLVNPSGAAWSVPADSIRKQYEVLWKQIYELYRALHEEMESEQKGYIGMRQRAVISHWADPYIQDKIAGRMYIFVGFNYLLPVERELMMRLKETDQAMFYWDYVPDFETNEKAFSFAQLNSGILGNNGTLQSATRHLPVPVTLVSCVSREAQAQYVHKWLQDNYTARGQKVGVVICDETMLEPVIYTLPAITLPGETEPVTVNITKGFPLRNTQIYSRVLQWLSDPQHGKPENIVTPDLIGQMIADLFPENEQSSITGEPSALSWQELLILESEYQVRKIANQLLSLVSGGLGDIPFTFKLLRLLMRRTMESMTMPFHGEPVTDVQVMGVLETRLMDFDKLLLLNVEEGVLPQRQTDSSFIPFYLRKAYHMQTSDERATVYAYNFFRLLSRAGEATVLYAAAETSEGGKGMSRFVMQMMVSPEFHIRKMRLQEPSVLMPVNSDRWTQTLSLLSTLSVDNRGVLRRKDGRPFRLSPSALNTYVSCPRSFYMQYVLGLHPKEEEEVLFAPNTMGSFVHHTMEYVYRTYLHCDNEHPVRVSPNLIEAVLSDETKLQAALMAAYEAMEKYVPEHHAGENVIIIGYVKNILERDLEDAKSGLQIYLLEQERTFTVDIDGVGKLLTGGIIDRLDIYGAPGMERLRVVDYKSGSYGDKTHEKKMTASWEELMDSDDKNYVRQTLIYSHAVTEHNPTGLPVEPHLYFCRRRLTDIRTTIDVEGQTVNDYQTIRKPFYEALQAKIQQILTTTDFPQCEEENCPSYCPFFSLCGRKPKEF